jgi:hypothetical protein
LLQEKFKNYRFDNFADDQRIGVALCATAMHPRFGNLPLLPVHVRARVWQRIVETGVELFQAYPAARV